MKLLAMLLELEKQSVWWCYLWRRDDAFSPCDGEAVWMCLGPCVAGVQQQRGAGPCDWRGAGAAL